MAIDYGCLPRGHLGCCWQTHLNYYAKSDRLKLALALYSGMSEQDSSQPNPPAFVALIKACTKLKDLDTGLHVHARASKLGFTQTNLFVGSALIDMYAKCGSLPKAQQVFDSLLVRDVVVWTALIAGNIENGLCEEALMCFERMCFEGTSPNTTTFVCCLKACGSIGSLHRGQGIHAELERQGVFESQQALGNSLINMYVKCGLLVRAHEVLRKLPVRDVISWTALMVGYVEHGDDKEALLCLKEMHLEGIAPNVVTFAYGIKACTNSNAREKGQELHAEIERRKVCLQTSAVGVNLVEMYSKWGLFAQAWQMFDRFSAHDVELWNVLISGYMEHGDVKQTILCFQSMLYEGIHPNPVTFVYTLKACGSLGDVLGGQELHVEIERKTLLVEDIVLGNALVDMYAKCGCLVLALQVFSRLSVRDSVSWTALIEGYAEHDGDEEALKCLEQMQLEGVSPNGVTLACSLKSCGNLRAIKKGQTVHAHIEKLGLLERNPVIWNALIVMYLRCDFGMSALSLFHKLPVKDVVSWTALIAGYIEHGWGEEALHCIEQMQIEGIYLNIATFSCGFKACTISAAINRGRQLHAVMEIQGLLNKDNIVGNSLVDMYAKLGLLHDAKQVLDRLCYRDEVSWATLMTGYIADGQDEQVLDCYEQLQAEDVSLDPVISICCLNVYSRVGGTEKGTEMHAEIERLGLLESNPKIGSALVHMYARGGLLKFSQEVFDKIPVQTIVLWNVLIDGYARQRHAEEAFKCFEAMQLEGVAPDIVTFVCLLKTCSSIGASGKGQDLHADIEGQGFMETNLSACSCVVDMYAKCGFLEKALRVCARLSSEDTVVWNTAITAFVIHKHYSEALMCFERMQLQGVSTNAITYTCSLKACSGLGASEMGQEIHTEIEQRGMLSNTVVGSVLVNMYATCHMLVEAHHVFDRLPLKDVVSWTALMAGYARLGEGRSVFSVLHSMLEEGVKPDSVTFSVVLSACSRMFVSTECWMYIEAMSRNYGFLPSHDHLVGVVDMLGHIGHLDDAIEATSKMISCPNPILCLNVVNECKSRGNISFWSSFLGELCVFWVEVMLCHIITFSLMQVQRRCRKEMADMT